MESQNSWQNTTIKSENLRQVTFSFYVHSASDVEDARLLVSPPLVPSDPCPGELGASPQIKHIFQENWWYDKRKVNDNKKIKVLNF